MALARDDGLNMMSLEEFFAMAESDPLHRYEYIDGQVYMMTGGSPDHSIISSNIGRILGNFLRKTSCRVYNSDVYIQFNGRDCICPDVSVSCDRRDRGAQKTIQYPCLIIEVLSPGTRARDRGLKADLYQNIPSVQELLLVDTQFIRVQLYRREEDCWSMRNFGFDSMIELASVNVSIPVVEMYEKTSLDKSSLDET
jgi:Uma2 family endonuclease